MSQKPLDLMLILLSIYDVQLQMTEVHRRALPLWKSEGREMQTGLYRATHCHPRGCVLLEGETDQLIALPHVQLDLPAEEHS